MKFGIGTYLFLFVELALLVLAVLCLRMWQTDVRAARRKNCPAVPLSVFLWRRQDRVFGQVFALTI